MTAPETPNPSPEQKAFALSILEAREKAGSLTPDQANQLTALRTQEQQRRKLGVAGSSIEANVYQGGVTGTPLSDNPLKKVEENRAIKQAKLGSHGGSTG